MNTDTDTKQRVEDIANAVRDLAVMLLAFLPIDNDRPSDAKEAIANLEQIIETMENFAYPARPNR